MGVSSPNEWYSNANSPIKNNEVSTSIIMSKILEFMSSTLLITVLNLWKTTIRLSENTCTDRNKKKN